MTAQNRSVLKGVFETGDVPDGDNYADLIDSFISLSDSTAQAITSNITVPAVTITGIVSANDVNASSASIISISVSSLHVTGVVSAATGNFTAVSADNLSASAAALGTLDATTVSAATITFNTISSAMATVAATGGTVDVVPTTAAGYIHVQMSGRTVAIPYFEIA